MPKHQAKCFDKRKRDNLLEKIRCDEFRSACDGTDDYIIFEEFHDELSSAGMCDCEQCLKKEDEAMEHYDDMNDILDEILQEVCDAN